MQHFVIKNTFFVSFVNYILHYLIRAIEHKMSYFVFNFGNLW